LEDAVASGDRNDEDAGARNGKLAVIDGDGLGRAFDPGEDLGLGQVQVAGGNVDLDGGAAGLQLLGRGFGFMPEREFAGLG
jgi:hypothetical protein